jgi:hypothetical protein
MTLNHDDVVVRIDIHGDEEKMRVLWKTSETKVRVKSLTHPHKPAFAVDIAKIVRNEGKRVCGTIKL